MGMFFKCVCVCAPEVKRENIQLPSSRSAYPRFSHSRRLSEISSI